VTGNWAANVVTISGTPSASGTFPYTVTLTGGCGTASASGSINVKADNTITLTSAPGTDNQTVCVNTPIVDITYITTGATGANFTGLPAGMMVSWAANNIKISGTPATSGVFNYTIKLSGGCGNVTANGSITVLPVNTITLSSAPGTNNQTLCINTALTNITYATTGATGATFSGLPAGVTGNWAADAVTISGTPSASGTFNYTVTLTGGCGSVSASGTITVTPDMTIALTSAPGTDNQNVCVNAAINNITYATTGATGALFGGLPAGVTGNWAASAVTISGTPTLPGTYNYTVTLAGGCGASSANGTITVSADNTITFTSAPGTDNQTLCVNTALTNITYATTGATGATFSGLPAGVTGIWAADAVTISGTPSASGTFNYTVTLTGGCGSVSASGTITVTPDMTIALTSAPGTDNQNVCVNAAINNITYATTGATGALFGGLPAGVTGNWAASAVTISGTPTLPGTYNYTVTLAGGCGNIAANGTITVGPDMTMNLTSALGTDNQTLCVNTALTNITYATTGATGATFSGLPAGVTGNWAADVVTISGSPSSSGTFSFTVTLTGNCGAASANGTISVTADNTIVLSSAPGTDNQSICINDPVVVISYNTTGATGAAFAGLPAGVTGTWAADAVTISGTPSSTGTFNYTVTLTGGCGNVTTGGAINVIPVNTITLTSAPGSDNQTVCLGSALIDITYATTNATGATFFGLPAGVSGSWASDVVTISGVPSISGVFFYSVTLTGGCGNVATNGAIIVSAGNAIALISAPGTDNQTLCTGTPITEISYGTTGATGANFSGLPAGVNGSWAFDVVTINGSPSETGTFNYTVTLTGGCGNVTANGTIVSATSNTITLTSAVGTDNQTVCVGDSVIDIVYATTIATGANFVGLPTGMTVSWESNIITINGAPTMTGVFNYSIELTGGCGYVTANGTITVRALSSINITSASGTDNQVACINAPITDITYTTVSATGASFSGLPDGVTGAWASDIVTISGSPTAPGTYNYTVTLTGGCGTATASGTILVPSDNTLVLSSPPGSDNQTLCMGNPVSDITYATTGAAGANFSGLPAGVSGAWAADSILISGTPSESGIFNYTITLTGGCGSISSGGMLTVNSSPSVVTAATNVICKGTATGAIDISVTGGTAPLVYLWSNGATSEDITGLLPGIYSVSITDANLCSATASDTITEPATLLSGSITAQTNVTVHDGNDGSVTVDGSGGSTPYMYRLNTGAYQASGTFDTLTAGSYTVTIRDANQCMFDVPVTITQPLLPLDWTIVTQVNVGCRGDSTGVVTVSGVEGLEPYEYSIDGGPFQASGTFAALKAGSYVVAVRDAMMDTVYASVTITQPASILSVTATHTDAICNAGATGTATASGAGGTAPYSYSWNTVPVQGDAVATGLLAGTYTVVATDANGCTASTSVVVSEPAGITVVITKTPVSCHEGNNGTATATPSGGTAPYTYSWDTSPVQTTASVTNLPMGLYNITVTDAQGCTGAVGVTIVELPELEVTTLPAPAKCPDSDDGSITIDLEGGTAPYRFLWNDGITTADRTGLSPGTYTLIVRDTNNCQVMTSTELGYIGAFSCLVIPQVITPNNDGYNDEWVIKNIDIYPNAEVKIYTRWGKLIYRTRNISANPWDGRFNGKLMPTDSYHYILLLNDGSEPRSGVISVIR
jgi:gliding motility-associated-like protein